MQPMPHQLMGYDRAITMFSPDGRLLQVEYAKKTVRQGSTAIGIVCSDGILLVTDKRIVDTLIDACDANELYWQITKMATVTSIYSESRSLIRRLRMDGHATTVDAETSHIATTVGFRSQDFAPDDPHRLHFGGIYFVSDRFTSIDHKDMRGDSELRRTRSQQIIKAAIDAIKMIEERYEERIALP